jgi:long-chain acyl-CoA synthetase
VKNPPLYPTYPIETLRDLLLEIEKRYESKIALQSKKHGQYQPTSYHQLARSTRDLASSLFGLGLKKGDRIAVLGPNRTEWAISYLAVVCSGFVAVPIDKDLKPREIGHILKYSGAVAIICSQDYVSLVKDDSFPSLKTVVSMEEEKGRADVGFPEFLQAGYQVSKKEDVFERTAVTAADLAAIIFTSGTTGSSKAVMLSHGNLASNVVSTSQFVSIANDDRLLSVLPLHHTYECTCGFLTGLYQGAEIFYAESLRRIPDNLLESRASVLLGVPLLFENMYRKIEKGIKAKGEGKFKVARGVAGLTQRLFRVDIRRKLFKELHEKFGGNLNLLISGGAAGNPEVSKGFRDLGIDFIQGYGMTEAAPLVAVNRVDAFKDVSVGRPIPEVEVRFEKEEILVRGPNVMKGYYLNEGATAEVITEDGWLRTGDLGFLDKDGFLHISGRRKSLIVTPNGKNVYPEEIEAVLNDSPYVLESLVWGGPEVDPRLTEVQALIVPDIDSFDREFGAASYGDSEVHDTISAEVKRCNKQLAGYKRIKKFSLRETEFEKTTTRKIKRYLYTQKAESLPASGS